MVLLRSANLLWAGMHLSFSGDLLSLPVRGLSRSGFAGWRVRLLSSSCVYATVLPRALHTGKSLGHFGALLLGLLLLVGGVRHLACPWQRQCKVIVCLRRWSPQSYQA